jgi:type IX secretion system PorP/SprF family membrane protein
MGQQRPIQSLYMFDPLVLNPAFAGTQIQLSATMIYRNQWVNFEGAPETFTQTAHSGFRNSRVGVGYILTKDQIGIHDDIGFYGVYSYRLPVSRTGSLSFGLQGGFNNLKSNYNLLTIKNQADGNLSGVNNAFIPNVGAGFYYKESNYYIGFSVPYILNNVVVGQDVISAGRVTQKRYYYVMAGLNYNLSKNVKLFPSTLIRVQDDAPVSFDLNTFVVFYDAVGLGLSYRHNDAIIPMFELQLNDNFHVGYAYDITTSALNQYSNGSHELMVNYRVKIPSLHKGLACPTYWGTGH